MNYFLILLLIAGVAMPFIYQPIKVYAMKIRNAPAWLGAVVLDFILALLCIYLAGVSFAPLTIVGAVIIVYCVAHVFYDSFVGKFFPGRGSI
jgi:VanZ family protein